MRIHIPAPTHPQPPQAKYLLTEAPLDAPIGPRFLAGAALWLAGWVINLQADHILINLRKPGETGGGGVGMVEGRKCWGTCMKELVGSLAACARLCRVLLAPHILPALPRPAQATRSRAAACLSTSRQPTTLERWWSGRAGRWPPGRSRPPPLPSSHSPTWRPGGLLVVINPRLSTLWWRCDVVESPWVGAGGWQGGVGGSHERQRCLWGAGRLL